jgi:hypothetical protein
MDKYLEAIKNNVCTHRIDADQFGNCRISPDRICAIESNYDRIVKSILATKGDRYADYVAGLRENVCENCSYGTSKECNDRDHVECPLDRYYPMIVDVIEEVGIEHIRQAYAAA